MEVDLFENEDLTQAISIQASQLHRKYGKWAEREDITQTLWVGVLKHRKQYESYIDRDPEDQDMVKQGWAAVYKSLWREGERYCRAEKAAKSGYSPSDEAFYDKARIASLMDMQFNGTALTNQYDDSRGPKGRTKPGSGYNLETEYSDIDLALTVVTPTQRAILMMAFVDDLSEEAIGDQMGMARSKVHREINRAVNKMIKMLGGESPY